MSGDDHRQPGPILGQIPHLPRPARLADGWHCKQLPNGANPIVVCERAVMLAEVERLRAAGDALVEALAWWGKGNDRGDAARAAWEEARRG